VHELAAITLIMTVIMPGQVPDNQYRLSMPVLAECWEDAALFLHAKLPYDMTHKKLPDGREVEGVGRMAGCFLKDGTETKT